MSNEDKWAIVISIFIMLLIFGLFTMVYIQESEAKKDIQIVRATVIDKNKHTSMCGKMVTTYYDVKVKYENFETTIDDSTLFDYVEIGDKVNVNLVRKTYKNGEVSEYIEGVRQ